MATQNTCDNGSTTQVPSEKAISGKVFQELEINVGKTLGILFNKSKCSFIFVSFREGIKYFFVVPAIAVNLVLILSL